MLTSPQPRRRRARQQRSLRQEYGEFILERIEEFKQQISREELLAIADEAVRELEVGPDEQLVLTEVLVLEHVDRLIMRRLNLPTYRRWRARHLKLRRAQREPTHWGLDPDTPFTELAQELDDEGDALVVGAGAAPAAFYLAAHDWPVVFIDQELATVEAAERRAAAEALASRFQALVVSLGDWFPDVMSLLVVIDPAALGPLDTASRGAFFEALTTHTMHGGVHCILPPEPTASVAASGLGGLKAHYSGWRIEPRGQRQAPDWLVAVKS
ncbi:MAG: hypothetical protein GTN78_00760 [Gemmatimonadales bacterium]|nr:hypothetical protein [Gemmatimonadales bacterium]NIN10072.1 hypothetical protein [Gemmatimonadales bacterium]NIQ98723.1 hypothetical protein [Gemmatimonadales bacterium]NIS63601.1 hypothetical protein [Gemmatimonadales bacterium]